MRPMRGCKKPRLVNSSDEENEAEMDKMKDLVQRLPCYQGEGSLAIKTKKSVEEDMRQLEEVRKQLKEEMDKVDNVKNKVEEDKAQVEQERVKVELAKLAVEEDRVKVEEERVKVEKLSKELKSQVECPVCLTMPREDRAIPCCPQGHIVCSTCRDKSIRQGRLDCPTCRVPMGQGRSLLALTVIKNVKHECGHQGCNVKLELDQIKEHEETCVWKLILCPGNGSRRCTAVIPLCNVLNHAEGCLGCDWSPFQVAGEGIVMEHRIEPGVEGGGKFPGGWLTKVLKSEEGWFFFIKSTRKAGIYKVDVMMKGSQKDCEDFMVEASILNAENGKPVFKSSFQPRPLTDQKEAIYCLSVPERGLSGKSDIICSVRIVKLD